MSAIRYASTTRVHSTDLSLGLPLCETDLTPDEDLRKAIKKWILQRSMEQSREEPSLEAAPKSRVKSSIGVAKATAEADDDLYDF